LNEGFGRSLHEVASRAREADQYALDGQSGAYYQGPDDLSGHYGYNGTGGSSSLPYQQQPDFNLGAFEQNFEQTQPALGEANLPSLRDSYQLGPDLTQGAWNPSAINAGTAGPMNQLERPGNFGMQAARPNDGPLSGGDQHGIEHAAALLSMAYQMHKERKPTLEDIPPTDTSSDPRLLLHNSAIDPGLQGQDWTARSGLPTRPELLNIASSTQAHVQQNGGYHGQGIIDRGSMGSIPSGVKMAPSNPYRNGGLDQLSVYTGGEWSGPQIIGAKNDLTSNDLVSCSP